MAKLNKLDSNETQLFYSAERTMGRVRSDTSVASDRVRWGGPTNVANPQTWYEMGVNAYPDFGGETTLLASEEIRADRQASKANITGVTASGSVNADFKSTNLQVLMQSFFFANLREQASTRPYNVDIRPSGADQKKTNLDVVSVGAGTSTGTIYTLSGPSNSRFVANDIVLITGCSNPINNGVAFTGAATGSTINMASKKTGVGGFRPGVAETLTSEAKRLAKIQVVGKVFADLKLAVTATKTAISSVAIDMTSLGLTKGQFIFVGADKLSEGFPDTENNFWGRISNITAAEIEFDRAISVESDDNGEYKPLVAESTGRYVTVWFGPCVRNERANDPDFPIVRRSFTFERRLGRKDDTDKYEQAEYVHGGVANELTINISSQDKINADLAFVAIVDSVKTGGADGNGPVSLDRPINVAAIHIQDEPSEAFYNTSTDVFDMFLYPPSTSKIPNKLFAFVQEATFTINNNITPNNAVAYKGAFDVTAGQFTVGGAITAYFNSVEGKNAIINNDTIGFTMLSSKGFAEDSSGGGMFIDIPQLALGGGKLAVALNEPITIPLDMQAFRNDDGYTAMMGWWHALPNKSRRVRTLV